MGTKSHCSLLAYINIWKELLLNCSRDKWKIALFSKLSNFYFDLRPLGQDRGAKTRPLGQLECANPRGSPGGMVRLGIDWYIIVQSKNRVKAWYASGGYHDACGGYYDACGDTKSTSGNVQYIGRIPWVQQGISWVNQGMFSTSGGYHDACGGASW